MGTTRTSGWAVFWFLLGFAILGTAGCGGGFLSVVAGAVVIAISGALFQSARAKEEA